MPSDYPNNPLGATTRMSVVGGENTVLFVGQGDVSVFIPKSEEEFLLFLPEPPPPVIPCWPEMVTMLNGVLIGQSDEFIKLQTIDPDIMALVESLPKAEQLAA